MPVSGFCQGRGLPGLEESCERGIRPERDVYLIGSDSHVKGR